MNVRTLQFGFPTKVVVVTLLSTLFFTTATLSFAATGTRKMSASAKISAVERTEAHIKQLKGELKITEAQDELWNNLTQVMRGNAKEMDVLTADRAENINTMNAVDSMKFHSRVTKVQLDQLEKFIPPFEALYTSMSDDQKKSADVLFRTGRHGKQKRK